MAPSSRKTRAKTTVPLSTPVTFPTQQQVTQLSKESVSILASDLDSDAETSSNNHMLSNDDNASDSDNRNADTESEMLLDPTTADFIKPITILFDHAVMTRPQNFLVPDPDVSAKLLQATKWMFDLGKYAEPFEMSPLSELLTDGFDLDQVWEQLQLRNKPLLKHLSHAVSAVISAGDVEADTDADEIEGMEDESNLIDTDEEDSIDFENDIDGKENSLGEEDDDDFEGESLSDEDFDDAADLDSDNDSTTKLNNKNSRGASEYNHADENINNSHGYVTEVDDEFFSLHEMEKFAARGEARDLKLSHANGQEDDDDWNLGIGYLSMDPDEIEGSENDDDMNANDIKYEDFFAPPPQKVTPKRKIQFNDVVDEREFLKDRPAVSVSASATVPTIQTENKLSNLFDDEERNTSNYPLSRFERDQQRLADEIASLEAEAVAVKSWTMAGEISGKKRPINSLLEEDLEIEHASRPTPVITEETTRTLEDLIKSRVVESLFDDVERKIAPKEKKFDPNRRNIINEEKSTKSLTDLYADDYRKKTATAGNEKAKTEKDILVETAHREINGLFKDLCMNLDALSNWHYTAKAPVAELEIVAGPAVPALSIEEVIPAIVSDAALAAPKEVYAGNVRKSETEMEKTDKTKARKKQKRMFKRQKIEREREQKAAGVFVNSAGNIVESVKKSKERAMDSLMKQSNVTIISDSKKGKGSAANVAAMKRGGGKKAKAVKAHVVERGGSVGDVKGKTVTTQTAQMLML
ncbi:u3 small nucleolar ribonucleoprotein MPP10 [Physocladia obscura]|uniref:U3 small nucleolar ribonucleoprotein protein MPP10 n=1 Tax=Physocladia obscura TaxID=109957 RepID=A0AAD5T7M0_9FUNG|nr:u3 small nucleolar ribonucleoprotein MPP10 [Physocladia obscura]